MLDLIKKYTAIPSPSGEEEALRNAIISDIQPFADEITVDNLGNILVFKKGEKKPKVKLLIDAHMDEVGLIITGVDSGGTLIFDKIGAIEDSVLIGKRVKIGDVCGVIGGVHVHLLSGAARQKAVGLNQLRIDIGAASKEEAEKRVNIGDTAVFDVEFIDFGEKFAARGIDDAVGCAVLVQMIKSPLKYDTHFSFSVQEEVGCRGAAVAAYTLAPDCAITIEATTAADLHGTVPERRVCSLSEGAVLVYMDNGTLYDRRLVSATHDIARQNGIKTQIKTGVYGATNAAAIHKAKNGVRTLNIALPCRYIHSTYGVADKSDVDSLSRAVKLAAEKMAGGEI